MKEINPNLIKLAEQTYNPDLKIDKNILEEKANVETMAPNLDGYIYVPSIGLYVAKERTLFGKSWYEAHEELHEQGLQMLTIPEFIEFIKYLKSGYQNKEESEQILDEILTVRNPWRAGWLDAYFKNVNGILHINYKHRNVNEQLKPQCNEPLEDCLMENKFGIDLDYWLNNSTKQGLPRKDDPKGKLYYWHSRDGKVAWLDASSDWAGLNCGESPGISGSSLGVRAAKIKE